MEADMPDPQINIFISYSHNDMAFVDRLEADVRSQGFATWVDRRGLQGGQQWRRELEEAIDRSQVLLVVLSPEAAASDYVQSEYGYARDEGKVVIPLYYRPCKVPMDLRGIQWIDFRQSYEQGIAALLGALRGEWEAASSSRPASKPRAEGPWNVPFARNPFFTGRGPLLERLHEQLSSSQRAALNQSQALTGLGGIGKTQAAIEYTYRYRQEYSAVFWVRVASRETLVADYVAIARLLSLPGQDAPDQLLIVAATKRWLEQHEGWLLILDNADELSLLTDFLPGGGQGHLLLTTRTQATGKIAQSLSVEKMELSEGMQLLLRRAKLLDPEEPLDNVATALRKAAQQLVTELDGLPLALDQAGAYIEETGCSLSEYLELYGQHRLALLKRRSSVSADYPHTVVSTWALSFSQIEQENPAAADLLRLCAFLHPDAIPEAILIEGAAELGPILEPVAADPLLLNEAIQVLRRYSLIKRDPEAKLLNVHRLVQAVLKDGLDEATQKLWGERAVRAVNTAFPEVSFETWSRCEGCLPHAQACATLIDEHRFTFPEAARLLNNAGWYLYERGLYGQAEPLYQRALTVQERVLGPEHPHTLRTIHDLATLYRNQGKYEQAEPLYQRALTVQERVLGPEHPHTVASREAYTNLLRVMHGQEPVTPQ
jgi:tetratricopeptide (TPR) repeat protein